MPPEAANPTAPPDESATQLAFTKKRVERVTTMYLEGRLRCDSLPYRCDEPTGQGTIVLCYLGDDLVRGEALNEATDGPARETYYYDGEEHYATVVEGREPGDAAAVSYLFAGNLIERSGPDRSERFGQERVRQAATTGTPSCP